MKKHFVGFAVLLLAAAAPLCQAHAQADLMAAAEKEGSVVFYSTLPSEFAEVLASRFNAAHPKIKMQWIRGSTSSVVQRYLTESGAGKVQVDVISHNDVGIFQSWAKTGLLMAYQSPEAKAYPSNLGGGQYWQPFRALSTVISYNTKYVTTPPTSVQDLLDPKYKGRVVMMDPVTAGDSFAFYYAIERSVDPEYWRKMASQDLEFQTSVGRVADQIASGEKWVGFNSDFRMVYARDVEKAPVEVVWPAKGTVVIPTPVGITTSAPHPNAAKVLYNWLLSEAGQTIVIKDLKQLSARTGAAPTPGFPTIDKIERLPIDFEAANNDRDNALKTFKDVFKRQ